MRVAACPVPAELTAFRSGALPEPHLARIADHVSACSACRQRLADLPIGGSAADVRVSTEVIPETAVDSPPVPPAIGPYRIVRVLGRGGMGVVYDAVHAELGSRAAVKVLARPETDPDARSRFRKEWLAVGRLDHPNVVRGLTAGHDNGVAYLAMELVDGPDAGKAIRQLGPLDPADAAAVVAQSARGLAHAHASGVVHRDVKPSNLLLVRDGSVKLLDLGLAQVNGTAGCSSARLTRHTYLGTADYMAPEQWDDPAAVGPAADVYALGCVLYHLLTGRPPFTAPDHPSPRAKMLAHQDAPPPDPRAVRPQVPDELVAAVHRMLAKRPDERPTAAAVCDALEPLAAGARLDRLVELVGGSAGFADGPPTAPVPSGATTECTRVVVRRRPLLPSRRRWPVVAFVSLVVVGGVFAAVAAFRPDPESAGVPAAPPAAEVKPPEKKVSPPPRESSAAGTAAVQGKEPPAKDTPPAKEPPKPNPAPREAKSLAVFDGFKHPLVGVAVAPDGKSVFTAELDGTIRRWDVATRKGVRLHDPKNETLAWQLRGLHIAPSGTELATFGPRTVTILDAATGAVRQTVKTNRDVWSVAVAADGTALAVGHDTTPKTNAGSDLAASVYDLATGDRTAFWTGPVGAKVAVAFGPNDRTVLAVDAAGRAAVLDPAKSGGAVGWAGGAAGDALVGGLYPVAGGRVVVLIERTKSSGRCMIARLVETKSGVTAAEFAGADHKGWTATAAGASADGRAGLIATSSGQVQVGGALAVAPIAAHTGKVAAVAASADGLRVVSAGADDRTVKVWELPAGK